MASGDIVQDPFLQSVLGSSTQARQRCMDLIDLAERSAISSSQTLPEGTKLRLSRQQRLLDADLASLRDASRESILEVRMTKQSTAEARQEVDRLHLQLQNLYYEERHLKGETSACESYEYVPSAGEILLDSSVNSLAINTNNFLLSRLKSSSNYSSNTQVMTRRP